MFADEGKQVVIMGAGPAASRAVKSIQGTPSTLSLGNPRKGKEQSQPAAERIEILLYHSISNENGVTSISPATFAGHLRILKEEGYSVIDPSDLIAWRERQVPLPPRAAILSFDDGFKDFADQAFPLIREQGWNPSFFSRPAASEAWKVGSERTNHRGQSWIGIRLASFLMRGFYSGGIPTHILI